MMHTSSKIGSLFRLVAALSTGVLAGAGCSADNTNAPSNSGNGGRRPVTSGGSGGSATTLPGGGTISAGGTIGGGGSFPMGGTTIGGPPTGGTTGAAQKVCATKSTVTMPAIVNFESYNGMVDAINYSFSLGTPGVIGGFYTYNDGTATPTFAILAGHDSSFGLALQMTHATMWGAGFGTWFYPSCLNASSYTGISFWVRGSTPMSTFSVALSTDATTLPDATNPMAGGTCTGTTATCLPAHKDDVPVTLDWTQIQLKWADFMPGTNGATSVTPNGDSLTGISVNLGLAYGLAPGTTDMYVAMPGDIDFHIDDITFTQ